MTTIRWLYEKPGNGGPGLHGWLRCRGRSGALGLVAHLVDRFLDVGRCRVDGVGGAVDEVAAVHLPLNGGVITELVGERLALLGGVSLDLVIGFGRGAL